MFISQSKIDDLIASDGAFLDLTTELLQDFVDLNAPAQLSIVTRQDLIFSGGGIARALAAASRSRGAPPPRARFGGAPRLRDAAAGARGKRILRRG